MLEELAERVVGWLAARGQAPLAGYVQEFAARYGDAYSPGAVLLTLVVLLAGLALIRRSASEYGPERMPRPWTGRRGRALRLGASLAAVALAAAFTHGVLGTYPHIADEVTYLFEARLVARTRAAAPAPDPLLVELSGVPYTTVHGGRWLGAFLPGWPVVLALGLLLGLPYLVNPLLAGASVWLTGALVERTCGEEEAAAASLLAALSPALLLIHGSLMADPLMLVCLLGGVLALDRERPAAGGLMLAWAVLTRPAAAFFVLPALGVVALRARRAGRLGATLAWLIAGALPVALLLLLWNRGATGSAWVSPYSLAAPPPAFVSGETEYFGLRIRHDAAAAAVNLAMNALALNVSLLGWVGLSLLPAAVGLLAVRARPLGPAAPWLAGCLGLLPGYALYFHPGLAYGPRFYLPWVPLLLALSARGIRWLLERLEVPLAFGLPRLVVFVLPVVALLHLVPELVEYGRYTGMDARPLAHVDRARPREGPGVVLVPNVPYPDRGVFQAFKGRVDPFMEAPWLYLMDPLDPARRRRVAELTGRRLWYPPAAGAPWDSRFLEGLREGRGAGAPRPAPAPPRAPSP